LASPNIVEGDAPANTLVLALVEGNAEDNSFLQEFIAKDLQCIFRGFDITLPLSVTELCDSSASTSAPSSVEPVAASTSAPSVEPVAASTSAPSVEPVAASTSAPSVEPVAASTMRSGRLEGKAQACMSSSLQRPYIRW
jgi:hypothetical protein